MKQAILKAALVVVGATGLLAGCATTVDWGGPLGHYRYHYDSRPIVYSGDAYDGYHYREPSTYGSAVVETPGVTYYHRDDD